MIPVYVAALTAGVLLAVYAMIHGVERGGPELGQSPSSAPPRRARTSLPALAAALASFGLTGYMLARWSAFDVAIQLVVAVLVSLALALAAAWVVRRSAAKPSTELGEDPRYHLMGQVARVTRAIMPSEAGEIVYEVGGARHATLARSTDGASLVAGTDVVIERIEDGVAYVEAWTAVEQRL